MLPGLMSRCTRPLLVGVVQRLGHRRHQFRRLRAAESRARLSRVARSVPSMYFETTKQGQSSVLPTSKTGTMCG